MTGFYMGNYEAFKTKLSNFSFSEETLRRFKGMLQTGVKCIACIGSGASYTVATYAAIAINYSTGIMCIPLTPERFANFRYSNIDCVFAFSYSGNFREIENFPIAINKFSICGKEKQYSVINGSWDKQRGFNVPEAVLLGCMFINYALNLEQIDVLSRMNKWEREHSDNDFDLGKNVCIFGGYNSFCAALDMKIKLEESGICVCKQYEKRDFAHGKFCEFEASGFSSVVLFKSKELGQYEQILLEYLYQSSIPLYVIESDYKGVIAEFDLLVSLYSFLYEYGKKYRVDFANPKYSLNAMSLFSCDYII